EAKIREELLPKRTKADDAVGEKEEAEQLDF
ncbi:hypothetical protein DFP76_1181, partial [Marinomonas aquiplantarum]